MTAAEPELGWPEAVEVAAADDGYDTAIRWRRRLRRWRQWRRWRQRWQRWLGQWWLWRRWGRMAAMATAATGAAERYVRVLKNTRPTRGRVLKNTESYWQALAGWHGLSAAHYTPREYSTPFEMRADLVRVVGLLACPLAFLIMQRAGLARHLATNPCPVLLGRKFLGEVAVVAVVHQNICACEYSVTRAQSESTQRPTTQRSNVQPSSPPEAPLRNLPPFGT